MNKNKVYRRKTGFALIALTLAAAQGWSQSTPASTTGPSDRDDEDDEEIFELSPFEVTSEGGTSYRATSTLAGSRLRTDLKDLSASISVVTEEFLKNTGAVDNQSLLQYTTNTEVGGIYGNYAGVGGTFTDGAGESATNLLRPHTNTRVRGLDSADNTRDYFPTDIPWDGYNVGRVDTLRGPNSILFGIGSPAGIINAGLRGASFETGGSIEHRYGSFGSNRMSFDYNQVLLEDELTVRVAGVYDHAKYGQKPAYQLSQRAYAALRWDPKFLQSEKNSTSIKANFEYGDVEANRPRSLPMVDRLTPFFDADKINRQFFDADIADKTGVFAWRANATSDTNFWLVGDRGFGEWENPVVYYDYNSSEPLEARQGRPNGEIAQQLYGYAPANGTLFPAGIGDFNAYARNLQQYGAANNQPAEVLDSVAGAQSGFWKSTQITDPGVFDFYNQLIDGPTKEETQGWEAYNIALSQTFLNDRIGFEAVVDRQSYHDGNKSSLGWAPTLSVDISENTLQYSGAYDDLAVPNPYAGRVFTASNPTGSARETERHNYRFTAFGEIRASDFMDEDSLLARILGTHKVTGLLSNEQYDIKDRNWAQYALSGQWSELNGKGYIVGDGTGGLSAGDIVLNMPIYLTQSSVAGVSSASDLNLSRIMVNPVVPNNLQLQYYDSHWKWPTDPSDPDYVDPAGVWLDPTTTPPSNSTNGRDPHNYVGWQEVVMPVLNADKGDIDSLYKDASHIRKVVKSEGVTWQGFFWDDLVVATAGVRRDRVENRAGFSPLDVTGVASLDFELKPLREDGISEDDSTSWGVVVHAPQFLRDKLPWGTDISLGYMNGNNARVENRYNFSGRRLPNSKGKTDDYSLAVRTLNDRLTFRATYYETAVTDANIGVLGSETSTLGGASGNLRNILAQGTGAALMNQAGLDGAFPNWDWYWNWANTTGDYPNAYNDSVTLNDPAFWNHPETIKEQAAIQGWYDMLSDPRVGQEWFDAFGYDIDVAKVQAGDWATAIRGGAWQPASYLGDIGTPSAGRVNGVYPSGTVDFLSRGWEFELVGEPIENLNVSINASKQHVEQTGLGADFSEFIELIYEKLQGPAGDLRVWWGGDNTFRYSFDSVWAAYQFQKETNGKAVAEMAPWRYNMTMNYRFSEGALKGFNLGGSYRWQDGKILGYALNEDRDNLDITKPFWSDEESYVDFWTGYEMDLSDNIGWRIQLNLRNLGKEERLTPISLQPDGSPAKYRIEEGMTWTVTNSFNF